MPEDMRKLMVGAQDDRQAVQDRIERWDGAWFSTLISFSHAIIALFQTLDRSTPNVHDLREFRLRELASFAHVFEINSGFGIDMMIGCTFCAEGYEQKERSRRSSSAL